MLVLKAVTILIAGLLSLLAVRHVMREMQAVKVKATTVRPGRSRCAAFARTRVPASTIPKSDFLHIGTTPSFVRFHLRCKAR